MCIKKKFLWEEQDVLHDKKFQNTITIMLDSHYRRMENLSCSVIINHEWAMRLVIPQRKSFKEEIYVQQFLQAL